jgi:cytochrome P450
MFFKVISLTRQFDIAGMKFAMLEMKATLSALLRKYQLLPADHPHHLDLTVVLVLKSLTGVVLRIQPRAGQSATTSE